jgi:hypothetical protein
MKNEKGQKSWDVTGNTMRSRKECSLGKRPRWNQEERSRKNARQAEPEINTYEPENSL